MTIELRRLIIISGLSGAGKTIALNTLEDMGLYCIDNLPISLLPEFANQIDKQSIQATSEIAIGIDARNPAEEIVKLPGIIKQLKSDNLTVELVFIEANDDTLTRRFSETRRKHPLSSRTVPLAEAIKKERHVMESLSEHADLRLDTSHTLLHELRDIVRKRIAHRLPDKLSIQFLSFGYKNGVPRDADYVFDVRCLPNPYWQENLRGLNGRDGAVMDYLAGQELVTIMIEQICQFVQNWLPHFRDENRSYLCVAVGCTGGQHRSVYITEQLASRMLAGQDHVIVIHRDIR